MKKLVTIAGLVAMAKTQNAFDDMTVESLDVGKIYADDINEIDLTSESLSLDGVVETSAMDDGRQNAAMITAMASVDRDRTQEQFKGFKELDMQDVTVENFSTATPAEVASYNFAYGWGVSKQEPLLEAIFPTIMEPIGTRSVIMEVDVDMVANGYSRNDGVYGIKDKTVPFVKTIDDEDYYGESRNLLVADSSRKAEFDQYFLKALETNAIEALSGNQITVAPYVINKSIPLMDLGQTASEAAAAEFDQNTQIAPFPVLTSFIANVGEEFYALDVSNASNYKFSRTVSGDSLDISLVTETILTVNPASTIDLLTNAISTELADIPAGYTVDYLFGVSGTGNLRRGIKVSPNTLEVSAIRDANGTEVLDTDPTYAAMLAAAEKLVLEGIVGFQEKTFIVNDDLARRGKLITLETKTEEYILEPNTPTSVQAPLKVFIENGTKTTNDASYIPHIIKHSLAEINQMGIRKLNDFANYLKNNIPNGGAKAIDTVGISKYFITPWYRASALDFETDVDSLVSSSRKKDIKAAFDLAVTEMVSQMTAESNYGTVVETVKPVIDIWIGCHSSVLPYVGTTVDLGEGYNVKVYGTRKASFLNKALIAPANFRESRNTEKDIFSFGAHLYTPTILSTVTVNNREITAQTVDTHAVFCPIMGELNLTGLSKAIRKIAQNHRAIA